jgi:hypothetical protein
MGLPRRLPLLPQWEGSATGVTIVIDKHEQRHRKCGSPSLQNKNVIGYAIASNQQQWAPVVKTRATFAL